MKSLRLLLILLFSAGSSIFADDSGSQKAASLETQVKVQMNYLLYLPKDYEKQDSWPLLLFLHGSGERGDDLELVKKHGPPKLIAAGKEFPFIVVSPQCRSDRRWEPIELVALLDDLSSKYKVDQDRICVTGLSMGGFGSWQLASFAPTRLAAIAPICGGGEVYWTRSFAHLPVWAFHGGKDTGVPLERSQEMVDALRKKGGNPKLTIYPEAGHDSWTETYDNPMLYEWLLEQRRVRQE
ncbi:MAG: prolyl oligopeptidase family serine peptidase [Rhodopirellula sp.]|nr:prolyl oligopeptidase family serine peptidase [Rhodopirellula sp.]